MTVYLSHFEAHDELDKAEAMEQYLSADYFRVNEAQTIALALRDGADVILAAIANDEVRCANLAYWVECGYLNHTNSEGRDVYSLNEQFQNGTPYFRSHIAMQMGFPELYFEYWGKHGIEALVFEEDVPAMRELLDLAVSCTANKAHPSDFLGRHEIPVEGEAKRGPKPAPKSLETAKAKQGYSAWVEACKQHNQNVADSWQVFVEARHTLKVNQILGAKWRDGELARLKAEMEAVEVQYEAGLEPLKLAMSDAKEKHSILKGTPKPLKCNFT